MGQPNVRVPVKGSIGKRVRFPTSTGGAGATIGVDFRLPNGTVPTLAQLAAALLAPGATADQPGNIINPGGGPGVLVIWQNVQYIPANILYPPRAVLQDDPDDQLIIPGPRGVDGPRGLSGFPGLAAEEPDDPVIIPGPTGAKGTTGATGATGAPGSSVIRWPEDPDDALTIPGPAGAKGATGATGGTGPIGSPGFPLHPEDPDDVIAIPGPPGAAGAAGSNGTNGTNGVNGSPGFPLHPEDPDDVLMIPGPPGAAGATGSTGAPGAAGANGLTLMLPQEDPDDDVILSTPMPSKINLFSVPMLDQGVVPTWTGAHVFNGSGIGVTINNDGTSVNGLLVQNNFASDLGIVVQTQLLGDAYFRAITLGVQNWSFGCRRSDGAWLLSNATGLGTPKGFLVTTGGLASIPQPSGSGVAFTVNNSGASDTMALNAVTGRFSSLLFENAGAVKCQVYWDQTNSLMFLGPGSSAAGSVIITSTALTYGGPNAGTQVDMTPDTGTFTGTLTGFSGTAPSGTCRWNRIGSLVALYIPVMTGTSNLASMTMTGLPAAIQPTRTQAFAVGNLEDAGVLTSGPFSGQVAPSSGVLTFLKGGTVTFTATGTKGVAKEQVVVYTLN